MKLKPVFTISALVASLAFSMSAIASDNQSDVMPCDSPQAQQKGEAQMQVNTQDIQKTEALTAKKINPAQDKSRHYHPRDGKT